MTVNDAYLYARRLWRMAWRQGRGPYAKGYHNVYDHMLREGYTEADYKLVRRWLKAWSNGRAY